MHAENYFGPACRSKPGGGLCASRTPSRSVGYRSAAGMDLIRNPAAAVLDLTLIGPQMEKEKARQTTSIMIAVKSDLAARRQPVAAPRPRPELSIWQRR